MNWYLLMISLRHMLYQALCLFRLNINVCADFLRSSERKAIVIISSLFLKLT